VIQAIQITVTDMNFREIQAKDTTIHSDALTEEVFYQRPIQQVRYFEGRRLVHRVTGPVVIVLLFYSLFKSIISNL
jgi:hypothetical protein